MIQGCGGHITILPEIEGSPELVQVDSNAGGCAGVLRQLLAAQDVVQMMLHVQDVILDQEAQGDGVGGTDAAGRREAFFGNPFH